jgi:hypothetical protein
MRDGKASSSDGSVLDRRVFVSMRQSSYTVVWGGDADLRALPLDGEAKKSVRWDCVGDDSRCFVDFLGVPGEEVRARLLQWLGAASGSGIDLSKISSWSEVSGCVTDDRTRTYNNPNDRVIMHDTEHWHLALELGVRTIKTHPFVYLLTVQPHCTRVTRHVNMLTRLKKVGGAVSRRKMVKWKYVLCRPVLFFQKRFNFDCFWEYFAFQFFVNRLESRPKVGNLWVRQL